MCKERERDSSSSNLVLFSSVGLMQNFCFPSAAAVPPAWMQIISSSHEVAVRRMESDALGRLCRTWSATEGRWQKAPDRLLMRRLTDAGFPFSFWSGISLSLSLWQCPGIFLGIKRFVGGCYLVRLRVLQLLPIRFTQQSYGETFMERPDWTSTSLDLVIVIKSAC